MRKMCNFFSTQEAATPKSQSILPDTDNKKYGLRLLSLEDHLRGFRCRSRSDVNQEYLFF